MEESVKDKEEKLKWPEPFVEDFGGDDWPNLEQDDSKVENWAFENKRILLRVVTWNLCAKAPPKIEELTNKILPVNRFHVYIVGTEECERSIAQSALNPSKKNWELHLAKTIGPRYVPVRSHTLQAIHIMAFVHKGIAHHCSFVTSAAVATGAGNTLGNKGGVAVYLKIGNTRILVVNAHLAAHQNAEKQRNADYWKICRGVPLLLDRNTSKTQQPKGNKVAPSGIADNTGNGSSQPDADTRSSSISKSIEPVASNSNNNSNNNINNTTSGNQSSTIEALPEDTKTQQQLAEEIRIGAGPAAVDIEGVVEVGDGEVEDADDGEEDGDEVQLLGGETGSDIAAGSSSNSLSGAAIKPHQQKQAVMRAPVVDVPVLGPDEKGLEQCGEVVIFMGDLNYRIKGNRSAIDSSLVNNMHDVLLHNDQLRSNMQRSLVLQHFSEPPLHFRPTYKLDVGSLDQYDTGSKRRIPAWTDRILFVAQPDHLQCIAYNADMSITTSDHKPVYASFIVQVNSYVSLDENDNIMNKKLTPQFTSESQVCTIM